MLTEMREFGCVNTLEELARYTLSAVNTLRDAGASVLLSDVLIDVSTDAAGADGINCQEFFAAYVNAHGG